MKPLPDGTETETAVEEAPPVATAAAQEGPTPVAAETAPPAAEAAPKAPVAQAEPPVVSQSGLQALQELLSLQEQHDMDQAEIDRIDDQIVQLKQAREAVVTRMEKRPNRARELQARIAARVDAIVSAFGG